MPMNLVRLMIMIIDKMEMQRWQHKAREYQVSHNRQSKK